MTATASNIRGTVTVTVSNVPPPPPPPPLLGIWWQGQVPPQKWMNFYTKVLSRFATGKGLKLTVRFELSADTPIPQQKVEETKMALRELGLDEQVRTQ